MQISFYIIICNKLSLLLDKISHIKYSKNGDRYYQIYP